MAGRFALLPNTRSELVTVSSSSSPSPPASGQGPHPGRRRAARPARALRPRPRVRLPAPATRRRTRRRTRLASSKRPGQPVVRIERRRRYRSRQEFFRWEIATAVAGAGARHQPVRPARRRGQQDRDARADRRLRDDGHAARRDADPATTGSGSSPTRNARRPGGAEADASPASCARTSSGSGRATTSRSSPTSR